MPISIMQWRVEIGIFNIRFCIRCKSNAVGPLTPLLYTIAGTSITLLTIFLLLCGDVELNPGPTKKPNSWFNFSICHWNINSLTSHNCEKVNLLEAYNAINKFHIICLSESFLDSSILTENNNLKINGYKMMRADHPNNVKRGGVCAYVRETLPFRNFSNSYLSECLTLEVTISNRKVYVITLYRSPSQTSDEFQSFISNLEKLLININSFDPHFVILLGDFNAKSKSWSNNDTTAEEDTILENLTSLFELNQLISHPTYTLQHFSSCIDHIFVNQPNLVIDSGIHPSLHQNCHHQIIFCKLNLKTEYPPPYAREVWDYGKAQTDLINRAIDQFDWINLFLDKNINEQVILFNRTILNIFHNFIPNKIILCDDRDPPWMNEKIKHLINKKKAIFRKQKESNTVDHAILSNITLELSNAITFSKAKYHERLAIKLNNPKTAPKTYWSILKTFVNGSKIPLIPPLLVNNEFVTDFLEKANLFNDLFREQCTLTTALFLTNRPLKLYLDFQTLILTLILLLNLFVHWIQIKLMAVM